MDEPGDQVKQLLLGVKAVGRAHSQIFRSTQLDKQLQLLAQADSRAAMAARCAETIIDDFVEAGGGTVVAQRLTRHGELRIKKGLKFDLGCGYRLIAQKREQGICFLYAGHHDACDRWLEKRRSDDFGLEGGRLLHIERPVGEVDKRHIERPEDGSEEYERQLLEQIDEKVLRFVFRGICSGRRASP